jgi:hypothetical protein
MPRGKRYSSQTKNVLMRVMDYFEKSEKKGGCTSAIDRTCKATGLYI